METFAEWLAVIITTLVLAVAIGFLLSLPVMWLWNGLLPGLFGFKSIDWQQALGLAILCRLMFGASSASSKS